MVQREGGNVLQGTSPNLLLTVVRAEELARPVRRLGRGFELSSVEPLFSLTGPIALLAKGGDVTGEGEESKAKTPLLPAL